MEFKILEKNTRQNFNTAVPHHHHHHCHHDDITTIITTTLITTITDREERHADFVKALKAWAAPWIMQVGQYEGDLDPHHYSDGDHDDDNYNDDDLDHDSDNDGDHDVDPDVEHNCCRLHFHMIGAVVLMPILIT